MLSTGNTATGRGSALITAAAAAHPGGYCTARHPAADAPRQIGQRRHERRAAHRRGGRRRDAGAAV